METVIRIKDLFIVLWEQRVKVAIVSSIVFVVLLVGLFVISKSTTTVSADIQLVWNGNKYAYPNTTTLVIGDITSKEVLETAKTISNLDVDSDMIIKNGVIAIKELNPTPAADLTRKYSLSMKVQQTKLSKVDSENFLRAIVKAYHQKVASQVTPTDTVMKEFNADSDVVLNNYVIHKALLKSYNELQEVKRVNHDFTFNNYSVSDVQRSISESLVANKAIFDNLVNETSPTAVTIKTSKNNIKEYIDSLKQVVSLDNNEIRVLESELNLLKTLVSNNTTSTITAAIEKIVKIENELVMLKNVVEPYNLLIEKLEDTSNVITLSSISNSDKDQIQTLYSNMNSSMENVYGLLKDYYQTVVRIVYLNSNEVRVKNLFSIVLITASFIASVGIAASTFWIMEDWDLRYKKRKELM